MPRKYLPSRVNFSFRGGRKRRKKRRQAVTGPRGGEGGLIDGSVLLSGRTDREGADGGSVVRGTVWAAMRESPLQRHGDPSDDLAHGPFGFVPRRNVSFGVCGQSDPVREHRYGELVNGVGD